MPSVQLGYEDDLYGDCATLKVKLSNPPRFDAEYLFTTRDIARGNDIDLTFPLKFQEQDIDELRKTPDRFAKQKYILARALIHIQRQVIVENFQELSESEARKILQPIIREAFSCHMIKTVLMAEHVVAPWGKLPPELRRFMCTIAFP